LAQRARILPPRVTLRTRQFTRGTESRGGDVVILNDFDMAPRRSVPGEDPSRSGVLTLDAAGAVRGGGRLGPCRWAGPVEARSQGEAIKQPITIPSSLILEDPATGIRYKVGPRQGSGAFTIAQAEEALQAEGTLRLTFDEATLHDPKGFVIPGGTRFVVD